MRLFEVLAELVLLIHLLWILWVILGWIVTRNRLLLRWFHIGSLLWGILTEAGPFRPCPLTIAEQWLQRRAGPVSYQGSFLSHYLEIVIDPGRLSGATRLGRFRRLLTDPRHPRKAILERRACALQCAPHGAVSDRR